MNEEHQAWKGTEKMLRTNPRKPICHSSHFEGALLSLFMSIPWSRVRRCLDMRHPLHPSTGLSPPLRLCWKTQAWMLCKSLNKLVSGCACLDHEWNHCRVTLDGMRDVPAKGECAGTDERLMTDHASLLHPSPHIKARNKFRHVTPSTFFCLSPADILSRKCL